MIFLFHGVSNSSGSFAHLPLKVPQPDQRSARGASSRSKTGRTGHWCLSALHQRESSGCRRSQCGAGTRGGSTAQRICAGAVQVAR